MLTMTELRARAARELEQLGPTNGEVSSWYARRRDSVQRLVESAESDRWLLRRAALEPDYDWRKQKIVWLLLDAAHECSRDFAIG